MKKEKGSEEGEGGEGGEEIGKGWEWFGKKEKGGDGERRVEIGKRIRGGERGRERRRRDGESKKFQNQKKDRDKR